MKTITLNGKTVTMKPIRKSKKGAQVNGARVHLDGHTFYIYGYEPLARAVRRTAVRETARALSRPTDALIVEILKSLSDRLSKIESPRSTPPMPPPVSGESAPH